jgi:PAS domain-containing protein
LSRSTSFSQSPMTEDSMSSTTDAAGIYFWDIATDTVYADAAAAGLFGFSEEEAGAGLRLRQFLERMHPDDLPRTSESIRLAMQTGKPYHAEYRVCRPDLTTMALVAVGQCFRNASGEPLHYAGLLFQKPEVESGRLSAVQLCLLAYDAALLEGKEEAAERIIDALTALEGAGSDTSRAPFEILRN